MGARLLLAFASGVISPSGSFGGTPSPSDGTTLNKLRAQVNSNAKSAILLPFVYPMRGPFSYGSNKKLGDAA